MCYTIESLAILLRERIMTNEYENRQVESESRKSFITMLFILLGFTFFSASMWTGAEIGSELSFKGFAVAVLLGNLILGVYTASLAYMGAESGLSTHLLANRTFGTKGSYLPSSLLAITQIGWFGVGVSMFALPLSGLTGINPLPVVVIAGVLMTLTAYYGIKSLTVLSYIAVPLITILGLYSVNLAVGDIGGTSELFSIESSGQMTIIAATSLVIGSFISGGTLTADYARYANSKKNAVFATLIAFFIGNSLMFLFGSVGAMVYGVSDIFDVMVAQGLILIAIIVLGLNIWTTNDNALYSSGLAFAHVFKQKKSKMVLVNGAIGTIFALPLNNHFIAWLDMLNTFLPPIGAILIIDYFVVKADTAKKVNVNAIIGWAIGVLVANTVTVGLPAINGIIASMIVYVLFSKLNESKVEAKELDAV